jgi:hypothetical protein
VLDAAGAVVPGSEAAGDEAGGDEAGGSVAGGGDEAGGDEAGGDEAGGSVAGGGDEAGGDEAGGDDAGGDEAGGDDAGGLPGSEDVDGCAEDWDTIGVGAKDVLEVRDRVGLRNMLGETRAAADGADEDDAPGLAAGLDDAAEGVVATAPAPACGCRWLAAGVWLAPIRAKAATAEPATSPPVRHAEASGREIRCRPGPPVPRRRG